MNSELFDRAYTPRLFQEDEMRYRARLRAKFFIQDGTDKLNPNCSASDLIQAFYSHEWAVRNELPK